MACRLAETALYFAGWQAAHRSCPDVRGRLGIEGVIVAIRTSSFERSSSVLPVFFLEETAAQEPGCLGVWCRAGSD